MLIEATGEVSINETPIKNLRMNFEHGRARIKFTATKSTEDIPVDLLITKVDVGIEGIGAKIELNGTEIIDRIPVNLKLGYSILKKEWSITGKIGSKSIGNFKELNNIIIEEKEKIKK